MAIADIVRRGYAATIAKVVTRGYVPGEPPPTATVTSIGSLTVATSEGSVQ